MVNKRLINIGGGGGEPVVNNTVQFNGSNSPTSGLRDAI